MRPSEKKTTQQPSPPLAVVSTVQACHSLVPGWLSSAQAPRPPGPWLSLAFCVPGHPEQGSEFLGSLTQWKSVDRVGGRGSLHPMCPGLLNLLCQLFQMLGCSFCSLYRPDSKLLKGQGAGVCFYLLISKPLTDALHTRYIQWTFVDWHPKNITGKM